MTKDFADRHVERWRDHWIGVDFDDEVERLWVRINQLARYLDATTTRALSRVDISEPEYQVLHRLMIRDTPRRARTGELAHEIGLSGPGMTKRLDGLEVKGWVSREPSGQDRRRIDVVITDEGTKVWRRAMAGRGNAEDDLAGALPAAELATLNGLLKELTLHAESLELPQLMR